MTLRVPIENQSMGIIYHILRFYKNLNTKDCRKIMDKKQAEKRIKELREKSRILCNKILWWR